MMIFKRTAMRNISIPICLAVLGIATFSSCYKEALVENKPTTDSAIMRVNADAVQTKTSISEIDASNYEINWSVGDAIACYEVSTVESTPTIQGKVTSTALASAGSSASFEMDFSGNAGDLNFSYVFVYPASKYTKSTGATTIYRGLIDKDQTFSSTSFDKNADLLISKAITDQDSRPTSVDAQFERIGATALMNIKAPTTSETIRKITFSTTEGNIQGYYKVYPLTGAHETALYSGGKSIELTPASTTTYTGTIPVWFRLAEITLSNNFTVIVETNKKTYTKVVDLTSPTRTIEFTNSGLTKFNVNMTAIAGVANASLDDGDYYIVAKSGSDYYALSSEANTTRLAYEKLTDFDPAASTYLGENDNLVWTITNDSDAIKVEQGAGTYLTPSSGGASTGATKKTYTLANGSVDGTLILNSVDNSGYGLRYNVGSKYFAFYNSEPSASMIADMYFMPKDPRTRVAAPTNVDASAAGTTITVIWDDAVDANIDHYLVSLSGTASDSQTVDIGDEGYEFTGLSAGTYAVSVESVPADPSSYLNSRPVTISNLVIGSVVTYTKHTGALVEGDYIIVYENNAMNTTVSSSRLQYTAVTPSDNKILNPDADIVWHIAASSTYWTIYNADEDKYVASTGAKNKAQLLEDGSDDMSLWSVTVEGGGTYSFENKKNKANSVNAFLRKNGTYGFACYAEGTGGALTLYKRD